MSSSNIRFTPSRFPEAAQTIGEKEILTFLETGRSELLDWLPGRAPVSDIAETLAAMANSRGGMVLLGVMPRADRPAGVDDSANASTVCWRRRCRSILR